MLESLNFTDIVGATDKNYFLHNSLDTNQYTVTNHFYRLVATNGALCFDTSDVLVVTVVPTPFGFFDDGKRSNCHVDFKVSDLKGTVATYFWDFGDSTFSNLPNPAHYYYTSHPLLNNPPHVCLTLFSGYNCSWMTCRDLYYYISPCHDEVQENTRADDLIFSPNPTTDYLDITLPSTLFVTVTNLFGEPMPVKDEGQGDKDKRRIDVRNLPAGIYFLQITNSQCVKFIKE